MQQLKARVGLHPGTDATVNQAVDIAGTRTSGVIDDEIEAVAGLAAVGVLGALLQRVDALIATRLVTVCRQIHTGGVVQAWSICTGLQLAAVLACIVTRAGAGVICPGEGDTQPTVHARCGRARVDVILTSRATVAAWTRARVTGNVGTGTRSGTVSQDAISKRIEQRRRELIGWGCAAGA